MIDSREQVLGAGAIWEVVTGPCHFFRLHDAVAPVTVQFMRNGSPTEGRMSRFLSGMWVRVDGGFDGVRIHSVTGQAVEIVFGSGECGAERLEGTVDVALAESVADIAPIAVGATPVLVAALNSDRRGLRMMAPLTNTVPVCLGGAGVTLANACIILQPGDLWLESAAPAAAWWAVAVGGGQELRRQEMTL